MATFFIKETDLNPVIRTILTDPDGNAVDLTGRTVKFKMKRLGASTPLIDQSATLESPADGDVSYTFTGTQSGAAGVYAAHWIVDENLSTQETHPNYDYDTVYIEWGL